MGTGFCKCCGCLGFICETAPGPAYFFKNRHKEISPPLPGVWLLA